jgi:hypothetical protein
MVLVKIFGNSSHKLWDIFHLKNYYIIFIDSKYKTHVMYFFNLSTNLGLLDIFSWNIQIFQHKTINCKLWVQYVQMHDKITIYDKITFAFF